MDAPTNVQPEEPSTQIAREPRAKAVALAKKIIELTEREGDDLATLDAACGLLRTQLENLAIRKLMVDTYGPHILRQMNM